MWVYGCRRANKDWAKSDYLRDQLSALGYIVMDLKGEQVITLNKEKAAVALVAEQAEAKKKKAAAKLEKRAQWELAQAKKRAADAARPGRAARVRADLDAHHVRMMRIVAVS